MKICILFIHLLLLTLINKSYNFAFILLNKTKYNTAYLKKIINLRVLFKSPIRLNYKIEHISNTNRNYSLTQH